MSTDAAANNEQRIIDVIRDSLYLFSEALDASGDKFALYGFSSVRRHHVRMHLIEGFNEPYDGTVRARLAEVKPGFTPAWVLRYAIPQPRSNYSNAIAVFC